MTNPKEQNKNKALHEIMEGEFQDLIDIIEQKQIIHEKIEFSEPSTVDPITQAAKQLHQQSEELGAETLADFFNTLENNARNGLLAETSELLENIHGEFENVKKILSQE